MADPPSSVDGAFGADPLDNHTVTVLTRPAPGSPAVAPEMVAAAPDSVAGAGAVPADSPFLSDALLRRETVPAYAWALLALLATVGVGSLVLTSLRVGGLWTLFLYSVPSNTVIAVLPHEPMLLIYGARADLWLAALAATAGTLVAGFLDHRIFVPMLNVDRISGYKENRLYQRVMRLFGRAPFAAIAIAGCTPVPFFPFKLLAFSGGYPVARYLGALALGRFPRYALILWVGSAVPISTGLLVAAALLAFVAYGAHFVVRSADRDASSGSTASVGAPRSSMGSPAGERSGMEVGAAG